MGVALFTIYAMPSSGKLKGALIHWQSLLCFRMFCHRLPRWKFFISSTSPWRAFRTSCSGTGPTWKKSWSKATRFDSSAPRFSQIWPRSPSSSSSTWTSSRKRTRRAASSPEPSTLWPRWQTSAWSVAALTFSLKTCLLKIKNWSG